MAVCAGLGPLAAGWLYDSLHHYEVAFWLCAAAFLLAALGIILTRPSYNELERSMQAGEEMAKAATNEGQEVT